jgi:hypothetical protein
MSVNPSSPTSVQPFRDEHLQEELTVSTLEQLLCHYDKKVKVKVERKSGEGEGEGEEDRGRGEERREEERRGEERRGEERRGNKCMRVLTKRVLALTWK